MNDQGLFLGVIFALFPQTFSVCFFFRFFFRDEGWEKTRKITPKTNPPPPNHSPSPPFGLKAWGREGFGRAAR